MNSRAAPDATAAHATAGATQSSTRGSNGKGMRYSGPNCTSLQPVQRRDAVGHVLLGEQRERARRRHLHLLVDLRGAHIERAAEDEREAEDVVDLIRIVAAAGGDDRVVAHGAHFVREDLRHRIGEREDDRTRRHRRRPSRRVTAPATDRPTNTSAPTSASAIVRAFVSTDEARLVRIHVAVRGPRRSRRRDRT